MRMLSMGQPLHLSDDELTTMKFSNSSCQKNRSRAAATIAKGAIAGAVCGLFASWAMNRVHGIGKAVQELTGGDSQRDSSGAQSSTDEQKEPEEQNSDPATTRIATAVSRKVLPTELTSEQKQVAGPLVHYGYGTTVGALYGGMCDAFPAVAGGLGLPFGIVLWLFGDEVAVPLFGLGPSPVKTPLAKHADALAAHVGYAVAADGIRRNARAGLRCDKAA